MRLLSFIWYQVEEVLLAGRSLVWWLDQMGEAFGHRYGHTARLIASYGLAMFVFYLLSAI